jgi:hypothetical protein
MSMPDPSWIQRRSRPSREFGEDGFHESLGDAAGGGELRFQLVH